MESYEELVVNRKAYRLALPVYRIMKEYPKEEIFPLVSQMPRSAISIPGNIAGGYRRKDRRGYIRFLHLAQGYCGGPETLISIPKDLNVVDKLTLEAPVSRTKSFVCSMTL